MASRGPLKQGAGYVPAYQVSGTPYVTSSSTTEIPEAVEKVPASLEIKFPFVTRWVVVQNIGNNAIKMGFTKNGVNIVSGCFVIPSQTSTVANVSPARTERLELRCKSLHFAGVGGTSGVQIIAGLTGLEEFPVLTGSDGFEGIG
tara:strand:+ start:363 stop:797 length:435 start_codon:yes stop_codon:yes gene_type:complete